jgi:hypothetical protein
MAGAAPVLVAAALAEAAHGLGRSTADAITLGHLQGHHLGHSSSVIRAIRLECRIKRAMRRRSSMLKDWLHVLDTFKA